MGGARGDGVGQGDPAAYVHEWSSERHVTRASVDLSAYPGLVVIHLGMRVQRLRGYLTFLRFARRVKKEMATKPDGLLHHDHVIYGPRHFGWRQYWRDFHALERWARSDPHRSWWTEYLRDSGGTGFYHEVYSASGGFEAIYDNMRDPEGMMGFAPAVPAVGGMFTARRRLRVPGASEVRPPVEEPEDDGADDAGSRASGVGGGGKD